MDLPVTVGTPSASSTAANGLRGRALRGILGSGSIHPRNPSSFTPPHTFTRNGVKSVPTSYTSTPSLRFMKPTIL